ncbi:ABC transporter substrate-binding protein [Mongoliimonas terrestris]|uniref:ABC transporter substrate-binding protein n=1 Tax=Mongoliimonas terrestris TaxID=1709001 RepID=UPI0009497993|nr:ABC transporter substrate-binding protein [Mongoliimonas terrestris]
MSKLKTVLVTTTILANLIAPAAKAEPSAELVAAAKAEGMLTTIALPHDWCAYGDVIAGFKAKYPEITVNELDPNAGSADELEAIKANKGNTGPQAPDVIDVGLSFGPAAKAEGLIQPYKVSTWDSIPADAKDADGYWYGDYYGVLAIGVNKDLVTEMPATFADLAKPAYVNAVAMPGDPRTGNSSMMTVYAAGLAAVGKGGADAATAGTAFFKDLKASGNLVAVNGSAQNMAQGATPVLMDWDYNVLAMRDKLAGNPPVEVIIPSDAVIAGVYVQAISAYAPHPNAAKLWMEYLYSDEGQLGWLKGYCHPIRFNDLAARGVIPQDLLDKMPSPEAYAKAVFPTLDEQSAAKAVVAETWATEMGAE